MKMSALLAEKCNSLSHCVDIVYSCFLINRNSSRNKNETMFGSGYENCPEFGVLGGVIFKLDIL
jgi:hypothetical protein